MRRNIKQFYNDKKWKHGKPFPLTHKAWKISDPNPDSDYNGFEYVAMGAVSVNAIAIIPLLVISPPIALCFLGGAAVIVASPSIADGVFHVFYDGPIAAQHLTLNIKSQLRGHKLSNVMMKSTDEKDLSQQFKISNKNFEFIYEQLTKTN